MGPPLVRACTYIVGFQYGLNRDYPACATALRGNLRRMSLNSNQA
jgi:hypothetical protein